MGLRSFFEILLGLSGAGDVSSGPVTEMQRWQGMLNNGNRLRQQGRHDEALEVFDHVLAEARQAQNITAQATVLGHIGAVYTERHQWEEAERVLREALALARQHDNPVLMAAVLNDLGTFLLEKGDRDAALEAFSEALPYARRGTDPILTAHILSKLADCYMDAQNASYARRLWEEANQLTRYQMPYYLGRLGEATVANGQEQEGHRLIVQALRLAHALGKEEEEVRWANALARRYMADGKVYEAGRLQQRVAALLARGATISADDRLRFLLDRAEVLRQIGQHEDAAHHAKEALALAEELDDANGVARAYGLLGAIYRALGQFDEAARHLQTALEHLGSSAPPEEAIALQLELARVQQESDPAGALETYEQAVAAARQADDRARLAQALTFLGRLYRADQRLQEALECWKEAARLLNELADHRHLAPLLCDMANIHKERGDRKQALTLYEQALVALNGVKHPQTRGLVLSNVANMYTETGETETARAFYEEAIAIAHDTDDRAAESLRLGNLGWFYVVTGQMAEAIRTLESALVISRQLGDPLMQAVQSNNLAQAYAGQGDYSAALNLHRQALALVEGREYPYWLAAFHSDLGETLTAQQNYEDAQTHLELALALSREVGDDELIARSLWRLGDLQRLTGDTAGASASYGEAARLARRCGAQRDLAYALRGQGELALAEGRADEVRAALEESRRLFAILRSPEAQRVDALLHEAV